MKISFENKVAIITGAGSGLGLATAQAFAEAGAAVVLADWHEGPARAAAEGLTAKGHRALAVRCDVSDDEQVRSPIQAALNASGRVDVAYNNAGLQNVLAVTADTRAEAYDRVMGISAALEYAARGIRVNAICPGLIQTPISDQMLAAGQGEALKAMEKSIPMGRVGRVDEIADAVLWLCGDASSYVTGQSISMDGGFTMR